MASSADSAGASSADSAGASSTPRAEEIAGDYYGYGEGMVPLEDLPKVLKEAEQDRLKDHAAWLKILEKVSRSMPSEVAGLSDCPDFHTSHLLPIPTHPPANFREAFHLRA